MSDKLGGIGSITALAVDPSTGTPSQISTPVDTGSTPGFAATDPSGAILFMANAGTPPNAASWSPLMSFSIATNGANAGAVSLAGEGAQFPSTALA